MPEKSCKSNNPVIVFGYFLFGRLLGRDAINRVCTYLFTRLHNRTDVALQRLCNCDGKPDDGDVAVQRLYKFASAVPNQ